MQPGNAPCRRAGTPLIVVLALACPLFSAGAAQAAIQPADGVLSPRLAELAKPSVSSAPTAEQARELGLASEGAGSLLRDGNRVLVYVRFSHDAAGSVEGLRAAGAEIVNVSGRYQTVTVAAKPDELQDLTAVPGVAGVREVLAPVVAAAKCPSGNIVSEGDEQLRAAEARNEFSVDGSDVTVGILSDSFDSSESTDSASDDVKSADLPGPANPCPGQKTEVDVLDEIEESGGEDEGRGMAQIVHDLAPAANLAFASAFNGEPAFAKNIEDLAKPIADGGAEANVITDDVFYPEEPFFQDGPVAAAVNKVDEEGVTYLSAAGNDNLFDEKGNEIASWEAPSFRDVGSCPAGVPSYDTACMDFNPGAGVDTGFGITVEPEETLKVDLQWAQPWNEVTTDLDAYLLRGGSRVAHSEDPNADSSDQLPFEYLTWKNPSKTSSETVELVIDRCDAACGSARASAHPKTLGGTVGGDSGTPRLKFALLENGRGVSATQYPESRGGDVVGPTIFGHSGAHGAISVAAVPAPIFYHGKPEYYSSRGPVSHYFGPVIGTLPAPELKPPEVLSKPDIAATDCGETTFFGFFFESGWRFCGTSAAAPHAAAVTALMLNKVPGADPEKIRSALVESAVPVGTFGPCAVGAGLVDAVGAVKLLYGDSGTTPAACSPPVSEPWIEREEETVIPPAIPVAPVVTSPNSPVPQTPRATQPHAFVSHHPSKVIRTRGRTAQVVFRFGADEPEAVFLCDVDSGPFHPCPATFVHRFGLGTHIVRVKARDKAGAVGPTETFRFQVKRRRGA